MEIAADEQFLNEQPGHDRFTGAGIICKQETERLPRQHFAVNGRDLVRQRIYFGCMDREDRIEQMGQVDALGFGNQAKQAAVTVEAPWPAGFDNFELRFTIPE
jgi:hypothetical protein